MCAVSLTGSAAITCAALSVVALTAQSPAGKTVWNGVYSDEQAARGQVEYASHCASCHLDDLSGYQDILKGDRFMGDYREASLYRLFDKIKTTMPRGAAGSLSDSAYLDILTYVLKANDFPTGVDELTVDDLQRVHVVGKEGSQPVPDFSLVQVVGCLVRSENGASWLLTNTTDPVRAVQPQAAPEDLAASAAKPLGRATFELMLSPRTCRIPIAVTKWRRGDF
jgi:mono/diheme cytochrome c family protein